MTEPATLRAYDLVMSSDLTWLVLLPDAETATINTESCVCCEVLAPLLSFSVYVVGQVWRNISLH